jgi:hypothetical protein
MLRNCLLKQVIEGSIEEGIKTKAGRRNKQVLDTGN